MEPSGPVQACNGITLPLPHKIKQQTLESKNTTILYIYMYISDDGNS
jgi:hypothetical protein